MDQIRKFHYSELQNLILCLFQNIFKTEEQKIVLKTRMELSYLRESRIFEIHLKNWSPEDYLKIGVFLKIKFRKRNFGNQI